MPSDESISLIDQHWARRLACTEVELAGDTTVIRSYPADPQHTFNVLAFRRIGGGCVINVHEHLLAQIAHFQGRSAGEVFDESVLREAFAPAPINLAIAAVQAYADRGDLKSPKPAVTVQRIDASDHPAIAALKESVIPADWAEASMNEVTPPVFAAFSGAEIASVAHGVPRDGLRHLGVLTVPGYRHRGNARAVSYAVARHFADVGDIIQWQARTSNLPSVAVRDSLGFVERYRSITLNVGLTH